MDSSLVPFNRLIAPLTAAETNMSSKMRLRTRSLVVAAVLALAQSASVAAQAQVLELEPAGSVQQAAVPAAVGGLFDWFGGGLYSSRPREDENYRPPRQRESRAKSTHATRAKRKLARTATEKSGVERRGDRAYDFDSGDGR